MPLFGGPPNIEKLKEKGDVPRLINVMSEKDPAIVRQAITALGELRDPRATPSLIEAIKFSYLQKDFYYVEQTAARALGEIGDPQAVKALATAALRGKDSMSDAAAEALLAIDRKHPNPQVTRDIVLNLVPYYFKEHPRRDLVIRLLLSMGDRVFAPLLSALSMYDINLRAEAALDRLVELRMAGPMVGEKFGDEVVEALKSALNKEYKARLKATEILGKIGDARVVEPLAAALKDENYGVRRKAVKALCQIGDARIVEPLAAALEDYDDQVRLAAVEALDKIGDARAVEPLAAAVGDLEASVRSAAVRALEKIGDPRTRGLLVRVLYNSRYAGQVTAIKYLERLGWEPENDYEQAVAATTNQKWEEAARFGEAAVKPLALAVEDGEIEAAKRLAELDRGQAMMALLGQLDQREEAVELLGQIGNARVVKPLLDMAKSSRHDAEREDRYSGVLLNILTREAALVETAHLRQLASLKDIVIRYGRYPEENPFEVPEDEYAYFGGVRYQAWKELSRRGIRPKPEEAVWSKDKETRDFALSALLDSGVEAVEALISVLRHQDKDICTAAASALGKIGDARAVEPLGAALYDKRGSVCEAAAGALGEIGGARAVELLTSALQHEDPKTRSSAAYALRTIKEAQAVEPLAAALGDVDPVVRVKAVADLGESGSTQAVEPLVEALRDQDPGVRESAVAALGKLGDRRALESFVDALRDKNSGVRIRAVEALENLGVREAFEPLANALGDPDPGVRRRVVTALAKFNDARAVEELIKALGDPVTGVRREAIVELEKYAVMRTIEAIEPLAKALQDEDDLIRQTAMTMMDQFVDKAREVLISVRQNQDRDFGLQVAKALHTTGGEKLVEPLAAMLVDKEVEIRRFAVESLGEIGDPRAIEPLAASVEDRDISIRFLALQALEKIGDPGAIDPLVSAFYQGFYDVRDEVVRLLVKLGWQPSNPFEQAAVAIANRQWEQAAGFGDTAADLLVESIKAGNMEAARALAQIDERQAMRLLVEGLRERIPEVQEPKRASRAAAEVLGQIGDAQAVKPLLDILKNKWLLVEDEIYFHSFEQLLERTVSALDPEQLQTLASLDEVIIRNRPVGNSRQVGPDPMDCAGIRTLAREEMARRGLRAA